jgi:acyl carrier protein
MTNIKTIIQEEIMKLAFKKVSFDESIIKSKLLDSISTVDLIVSIEERIGKQIPQYLVTEENFDTIDCIYETLQKYNLYL